MPKMPVRRHVMSLLFFFSAVMNKRVHFCGAIAQQNQLQHANDKSYCAFCYKSKAQAKTCNKRVDNSRHNHASNAASKRSKSNCRANVLIIPAACEQSHANKSAKTIAQTSKSSAKAKTYERACKSVKHKTNASKKACERNS